MVQLIRHLSGKMFLLMALILLTITAYGEELTKELMVLPRQANIVVSVTYETEMPDISLISPDGTIYTEEDGDLRVDHGEKTAFYYLSDALSGQWLIRFDKKSNNTITIDYAEYTPDLTIESFFINEISGEYAEIQFQSWYPKDISYHYVVNAVLLDESYTIIGRKELEQGTVTANRAVNKKISLSKLASYQNYYLELEVYAKEYAIETFDSEISEQSFSYTNQNQSKVIDGVSIEIMPSKQTITLDWTDYKVSCDQYLIACFTEEDPETPFSYETLDSNTTMTSFDLPANTSQIIIELTYLKNGLASASYRKVINWEDGLYVSIDTPENTNSVQAVITYETDIERNAVVSVNGLQQNVLLKGSSSFSVYLEEYTNELSIHCSLDETTWVTYHKTIYSDRIPPILRFYETIDAITVDAPFFELAGETEEGCTLTVNGTEHPLKSDGSFLIELYLTEKENIFTMIAQDPTGNQTVQNLIIYHGPGPSVATVGRSETMKNNRLEFLPLFFAMMLSIIMVLTLILSGTVLEHKASLTKGMITLISLRNVCFSMTVFLVLSSVATFAFSKMANQTISSLSFIRAAQRSPAEAYQLLAEVELYQSAFIKLISGAAIGLAAAIILFLLQSLCGSSSKPRRSKKEEAPDRFCMHCGKKLENPNAKFCQHCGSETDS